MIGARWLSAAWLVGSLASCGSAKVVASGTASTDSATADSAAGRDTEEPSSEPSSSARATGDAQSQASGPTQPPPPPPHDPGLVRQALDRSTTPPDERHRLGLRLAVVEQGPDEPWLIAVANRGERPLGVLFDLRTLSLEVTPPQPPAAGAKAKRVPKPKKPVVCELPKDVRPTREDSNLELVLDPGEALVDAFDPRLYCLPKEGTSPLVPGATIVPRLGFAEKTKTVWKKGKAEKQVLEQTAPFIARVVDRGGTDAPEPPSKLPERSAGELAFERVAVKLLVGPALTLGEGYAEKPPEDGDKPLALLLAKGSDAVTEREATVTVNLSNRSARSQAVYFRRELVSFELAGPTGLVACDAGPDVRAPDRLSFSTIAPGRRLTATSRLIELCPMGALRTPGLYLVHARFDAWAGGEKFGLDAFRGRLVSEKPALVRVRKGWGDLPPQRSPIRVTLAAPAGGEGSTSP